MRGTSRLRVRPLVWIRRAGRRRGNSLRPTASTRSITMSMVIPATRANWSRERGHPEPKGAVVVPRMMPRLTAPRDCYPATPNETPWRRIRTHRARELAFATPLARVVGSPLSATCTTLGKRLQPEPNEPRRWAAYELFFSIALRISFSGCRTALAVAGDDVLLDLLDRPGGGPERDRPDHRSAQTAPPPSSPEHGSGSRASSSPDRQGPASGTPPPVVPPALRSRRARLHQQPPGFPPCPPLAPDRRVHRRPRKAHTLAQPRLAGSRPPPRPQQPPPRTVEPGAGP